MLSARSLVPDVQLASSVIHRALEDASVPDERLAQARHIDTPQGPRRVYGSGLKRREREEAVRFLLDDGPLWRGAREAWCEIADLCPLRLQRSARSRIPASAIPPDLQRGAPTTPIPATAVQEAA